MHLEPYLLDIAALEQIHRDKDVFVRNAENAAGIKKILDVFHHHEALPHKAKNKRPSQLAEDCD